MNNSLIRCLFNKVNNKDHTPVGHPVQPTIRCRDHLNLEEVTAGQEGRRSDMQFALLDAIRNGRYRQAKLLVEARGSGLNCSSRRRRSSDDDDDDEQQRETPLIACCVHLPDAKSRTKFVRLLLDADVNPNERDELGMTALMHAAVLGQADVVLMLLDHKETDLEVQDTEGNTALMYAASFGHPDIVSHFLDQMGRLKQVLHLSMRNNKGLTAMEQAEVNGHAAVTTLLGKERPGFPSAVAATAGREFPDPRQLDRGPTPGSPLLSFPVRWHQRQKQDRQQKRCDMGAPPQDSENWGPSQTSDTTDQWSASDCNDHQMKTVCSLPRLCVKEVSGAVDTGLYDPWIRSSMLMTTDGVVKRPSLVDKPRAKARSSRSPVHDDDRLLAVLSSTGDSPRRSHSEPRNQGSASATERDWPSSSSSSSASDRFQQVLNLLDASILGDIAANDVDDDDAHALVRTNRVREAWQHAHYPSVVKSYHFTKKLHGRYFPPIRPIQTTVLPSARQEPK